MQGEDNPVPVSPTVNAVTVRFPAFDATNPRIFFIMADVAFTRSKITHSFTKYSHIIEKLPPAVILANVDLFDKEWADTDDPYKEVKERLTASYTLTPAAAYSELFAVD